MDGSGWGDSSIHLTARVPINVLDRPSSVHLQAAEDAEPLPRTEVPRSRISLMRSSLASRSCRGLFLVRGRMAARGVPSTPLSVASDPDVIRPLADVHNTTRASVSKQISSRKEEVLKFYCTTVTGINLKKRTAVRMRRTSSA